MSKGGGDISPEAAPEIWGSPEAEFASSPFYLIGVPITCNTKRCHFVFCLLAVYLLLVF